MERTIFEADHEAFRDTCRTFVDRQLRPHQEKHIANHEFGRETWLELGKQHLLGLNVPEAYGGTEVNDARYIGGAGRGALQAGGGVLLVRRHPLRLRRRLPGGPGRRRNRSGAGCPGSAAAS